MGKKWQNSVHVIVECLLRHGIRPDDEYLNISDLIPKGTEGQKTSRIFDKTNKHLPLCRAVGAVAVT